jgi:hypothetical protein
MNGTMTVEQHRATDDRGTMNNHARRRRSGRRGWPLLATLLVPMVGAAVERETQATIVKLYSYTQFGGGDIMVEVSTPATGCTKGFWVSAADPGYKATYALLLSAYHTQETLRIGGEDTQLWTGSNQVYCRMTFAGLL